MAFKIKISTILIFIIIFANTQYLFTKQFAVLPSSFTLIDDLLCICLYIHALYSITILRYSYKIDIIDIIMLLLLTSSLVSAAINSAPFLNVVMSLRSFFIYYIFYIIPKVFNLHEDEIDNIKKLLLVLVLCHIPFTIIQYYTFWIFLPPISHEDSAFGYLFQGCSNLLGILLGTYFYYMLLCTDIKKTYKIILSMSLIFSSVLTHSKVMYIFMLFLALYYSLLLTNKQDNKLKLLNYLLVTFITVMMTAWVAKFVSDDVNNLLSLDSLQVLLDNQLNPVTGGARLYYLFKTISLLFDNMITFLFGLGPGMYSSYSGFMYKSRILESVLLTDFDHVSTGFDPDITGLLGEYGFIGLLLFSLMLLFMFLKSLSIRRSTTNGSVFNFVTFFSGFILVFYFIGFINGVWQAQFISSHFWAMAGIMNYYLREENKCELA